MKMHDALLHVSLGLLLVLSVFIQLIHSSLISSSEVQKCQRSSKAFEPTLNGKKCKKKFVVSMVVSNGMGETGTLYADIMTVDENQDGITTKQQLKNPFRITVTKSDVEIHYPVQYLTSVNNNPFEVTHKVGNSWLGISSCKPSRHCRGLKGYCCKSSRDEKLSRAWEYKRGVGRKVGHYHSHRYSYAICMGLDELWYNVFIIRDPYITYKIQVLVQQLDYERYNDKGEKESVWTTVGGAEIGPQRFGQNTQGQRYGNSTGPSIIATWQGDFAMNTYLANFNSKYLLTPEWRASNTPEETKEHEQVKAGSNQWLIVDRHLIEASGSTCNKIGSGLEAFLGQEHRCYRKSGSCFLVTPHTIWEDALKLQRKNKPNHYFPSFYGNFKGPHVEEGNKVVKLQDESPDSQSDFQLIYQSNTVHKSLVVLEFTAEAISFVENRSFGRIVEALASDFSALAGSGELSVIVQNTGLVTSDYLVGITRCSDGIIRVSQQSQTLDPNQQSVFTFQISSSLNVDSNNTCFVELTNRDGNLLDVKKVNFQTQQGCVYCPAGECNCDCKTQQNYEDSEEEMMCKKEMQEEYMNPYWEPRVIVLEPCYYCWITNSFMSPVLVVFMVVMILLSIGMMKMLIGQACCRTKDGKPIDVVGVILGTANAEHTARKQRSVTIHFLLGACFFVYLPLLPLLIIFCNWRRRRWAKKRLKKKALRKKQRLLQKKQNALKANQGLLAYGNNDDITIDDAVKAFDKENKDSNKPTILVVSSSSDTDEQDFGYSYSSNNRSDSENSMDEDIFGEMVNESKSQKHKKKEKERGQT